MFNLAIDSKLRGCELGDSAHEGWSIEKDDSAQGHFKGPAEWTSFAGPEDQRGCAHIARKQAFPALELVVKLRALRRPVQISRRDRILMTRCRSKPDSNPRSKCGPRPQGEIVGFDIGPAGGMSHPAFGFVENDANVGGERLPLQ